MEHRSSWPLWAGLLLTLGAFFSFMAVFVNYPSTRDFPWATFLLFAVALTLTFMGVRRAFSEGTSRARKIVSALVTAVSVFLVFGFVFGFFVVGRQIPRASAAPKVGQKAPEFRLVDSSGKTVALSELLTTPIEGKAPKGVLLVFYRGYW